MCIEYKTNNHDQKTIPGLVEGGGGGGRGEEAFSPGVLPHPCLWESPVQMK